MSKANDTGSEPVEATTRPPRWHQGLTGYHWLVLIVASCGWLFDTMDQWLYNLAKGPALTTLLGPGAAPGDAMQWSTWCTAVMLAGWATGGFVFGMVGDKLGRTRTMIITVLLYAGFTGLSGFAQTPLQFVAFRFLTGLGIGGEFAAGAALVAETFPDASRATALGIMQASSAIGNMLAALVNLTIGSRPLSGLPGQFGQDPWRAVFLVGIVPALLVFVVRFWVKEPEKWTEARDKAAREHKGVGALTDLFRGRILRRNTLVGVGIAAVGVIGFWGVGTWSPELLRGVLNPGSLPELKVATERSVSLAVMAQNCGAFFGILAWTWIAQKVGRKPAFALTFVSSALSIVATFWLTKSFASAMVLFPIMGFCITSVFAGGAVYFPELYPTRLRATGIGFCYNVARYLAIAGPYTLGALAKATKLSVAATIVSVTVFSIGLLILLAAPETKGKPLPEDL